MRTGYCMWWNKLDLAGPFSSVLAAESLAQLWAATNITIPITTLPHIIILLLSRRSISFLRTQHTHTQIFINLKLKQKNQSTFSRYRKNTQ